MMRVVGESTIRRQSFIGTAFHANETLNRSPCNDIDRGTGEQVKTLILKTSEVGEEAV